MTFARDCINLYCFSEKGIEISPWVVELDRSYRDVLQTTVESAE